MPRRRAPGLGLLLLLGAAAACAAHPQPPEAAGGRPAAPRTTLNLGDYLAELEHWSVAVAETGKQPETIPALRQSLPEAWSVTAGGQRFEVTTSWLNTALTTLQNYPAQRESVRSDIHRRLRALQEEARALEAGVPPPPLPKARASLDDILHRREFAAVGQTNRLAQVRAWLSRLLSDLLSKLFGGFRKYRQVGEILVWAGIALTLILLALWLWSSVVRASRALGLDLKVPVSRGRNWRDWIKQALAAAGRGDYRDAVRCAYWAGVYRLDEQEVWRLERSRTPREYLRLLPADHAHRPPLTVLTQCFEIIWYGRQPATAGDFRAATAQLEKLGCLFPSRPAIEES
ncbi:MAG: DUF4129 domain-containing protein [Terriglobia bacterium]